MDLINSLGKKKEDSEMSSESQASEVSKEEVSTTTVSRGEDLLSQASKSEEVKEEAVTVEAKTTEDTQTDSADLVKDPGTWTKESALKEMKKARHEAKLTRLKHQEQLQKLQDEKAALLEKQESEKNELLAKASELDKIKAEQEDKKRDLSEKLQHRESRIAKLEAEYEATRKEYERKFEEMQNVVSQHEAEKAAREEVYKETLEDELAQIPEDYREQAGLLIKGAGDPQDALIALREAKLKGMFQDKTVVVNHSTPGASDGARATNEKLQEAEQSRRGKMSSSEKIAAALKEIRQGGNNSAYRKR